MSTHTSEPKCDRCQTPMERYAVPGTGGKEQAWRLACPCQHSTTPDVARASNESNGPNDRYRKVENHPWELLPCRLCGFSAELWQRWVRDDIWCSFGACSNLEDVDGEACIFHLPDSGHFYCERKSEAVRYWNLMMGPRGSNETLRVGASDWEEFGLAVRTVSQNCDMTDLARRGDWLQRELKARGFDIVRSSQKASEQPSGTAHWCGDPACGEVPNSSSSSE